jgi:DNA/RNA endonuclease G (NUC1)
LHKKDLNGSGERIKKFKPDPLLKTAGLTPVHHDDYTYSGYARGHLAPAEDFSRSQEAIESTFLMSNVIPQKTSINPSISQPSF